MLGHKGTDVLCVRDGDGGEHKREEGKIERAKKEGRASQVYASVCKKRW